MKRILFAGIILALSLPGMNTVAQNKYQAFKGFISFFSSAPLEDIYAENEKVKSLIDFSSNDVAFVVTISGFEFRKTLMQEHFNEKYMESHKFPRAVFSGKLISSANLQNSGVHQVMVKGDIEIHGVKKTIEIPGTINNKGDSLTAESEFYLKPADFDIKIPKLLIKNIAEKVLVKVKLEYKAKKVRDNMNQDMR